MSGSVSKHPAERGTLLFLFSYYYYSFSLLYSSYKLEKVDRGKWLVSKTSRTRIELGCLPFFSYLYDFRFRFVVKKGNYDFL